MGHDSAAMQGAVGLAPRAGPVEVAAAGKVSQPGSGIGEAPAAGTGINERRPIVLSSGSDVDGVTV
jgi:hypothetical protein